MAERAVITIDVEAGEARAQVKELDESLEGAEVQAKETSRSMEGLGDATTDAQRGLGGLTQDTEAAERGIRGIASAGERAEESLQGTGRAVDEFSEKAQTMRSSASASASNLGFELVQASQDAKFGMAGLANQIPLITEQFTRLQNKTGSTSGALASLASTFAGPTGVIAGVTLLLTFKDDIIGFFTDTEQSASDAAEEFEGFATTVDNLKQTLNEARETFSEIEEFDFSEIEVGRESGRVPVAAGTELPERQIQRFRNLLSESGTASRLLRSQLLALGVDLQTVTEGSLQEAQEELAQFETRINQIIQAPAEAIAERPEGFAVQVGSQLRRIQERQQRLVDDGLRDQEEAVQRQADFLRSALTQASDALTDDQFNTFFAALQSRLTQLEGQLKSNTEEQEKQLTALEEQEQKASELETVLEQIRSGEQDALIQQRQKTKELEDQVEAAREARRAVFRTTPDATQVDPAGLEDGPAPTIGEQIPDQIQGPQGNQVEGAADDAAGAVENAEARIVSAAGNMGAALVQAFKRGEQSAQQIAGTILQGIGGLISAIPGFGQILGPSLGSAGQIIGSFQHGGRVDTPLQIVGEQGPELAALPQGTQVNTNRETERIMQQAEGGMTDAVVQKLDEVAARVERMDVRIDAFQARRELQKAEQKVASSYPPSP